MQTCSNATQECRNIYPVDMDHIPIVLLVDKIMLMVVFYW